MKDIKQIETDIENLMSFPIRIEENNLYNNIKSPIICIWFSSIFAFAFTSITYFFIKDEYNINCIYDEFIKWYNIEGKSIVKKFNDIFLLEKKSLISLNIDEKHIFFSKTTKVGNEFNESINKYCNTNINDINLDKILKEIEEITISLQE